MNLVYQALAGLANALSAIYRWLNGQHEVGHEVYVAPAVPELVFRYPLPAVQPLAAFDVQAYVVPTPQFAKDVELNRAPVSLLKANLLVRPFVHLAGEPDPVWGITKPMRAVGRVAVNTRKASLLLDVDELGLPRSTKVDAQSPGVGIFEQVVAAWAMRTGNRDVSWA